MIALVVVLAVLTYLVVGLGVLRLLVRLDEGAALSMDDPVTAVLFWIVWPVMVLNVILDHSEPLFRPIARLVGWKP